MSDLEIRDLLSLARAAIDDPHGELARLYDWRYDHASTGAKAILAAGGSLVVAMVAAALQHKSHTSWVPVAIGGSGAGLVVLIGIRSYLRVRNLYREYVDAMELLGLAIKIQTFLRRLGPRT
jgi:hypothetical protein